MQLRLRIRYRHCRVRGDIDSAQTKQLFFDLEKILPKHGEGFKLLADYSLVQVMELEVESEIKKAMKHFNDLGVTEILRVIPNPDMVTGFDLMSRHYYSKEVQVHTLRSRAEAQAYLRNEKQKANITCRKIEIERISVISSKPFDAVVAALESAVGHPNMVEFMEEIKKARTFAELETGVQRGLGRTGLMLFTRFDLGAILRKESGLDTPKIVRFLIGNPLIMKEMAKHVPDAGSYAPVTILVDERRDGVHLSYDKMASYLAPYENPEALTVARDLDLKIEKLLQESAA